MAVGTRQSPTDAIEPVKSVVAGVGSFLVGYLVTLVLAVAVESNDFTDGDAIELGGWLFYNAQFVDLEVSATGGSGLGLTSSLNIVTGDSFLGQVVSLDVPSVVYHLIPVVVFLLAGFLLAQAVSAQTPQQGALAGGSIVVGTAPLALIGTFLFVVEQGGTEVGPPLLDSLLIVGLLFPLVLGVAGGLISSQT